MSHCPGGKSRYPSEDKARMSLRALRVRGHVEYTTVYLCSRCNGWHLTSAKQRAGRQA